jgi:hypothetical protein
MKPETSIQPDPACQNPVEGSALSDLRIECVSFDRQGLPRRRRLVSVMAMLSPPRYRDRRAAILAQFRD